MTMRFLLAAVLSCFIAGAATAAADEPLPEGMSPEEALRLGERMYRDGILPSGEPMEAVVMGDIPVDGRMFTCDDCHQRSGLGSLEGTVITWPTNGRELYQPRRTTGAWRPPESEKNRQDVRKSLPEYWQQIEEARPAYTDESLATVLWTGVDPAGRKLNPIMPLYHLEDGDMAIMVHYLKNLSVDNSPGVDEKTIRFATVVSDDVPEQKRQAMLAVLRAHIDVRNSQNRHQERRADIGPFYKTEKHQAYRRWELDVWELKGPRNTWPAQLQTYYGEQPVFALLGGMATGSWQPIHEFSEKHKIPTIFPLTDYPVISDTDWYTLYFSKGFYKEGETTARYLRAMADIEPELKIVIVYRESVDSDGLIRGFGETWREFGRPEPVYRKLGADEDPGELFRLDVLQAEKPDVLVLWVGAEDLKKIGAAAPGDKLPRKIMLSAELLENTFGAVPDEWRDIAYLTYPRSLPGMQEKSQLAVKRWLQARKIPITHPELQAKMYFLGWMLSGAVMDMRSEFFRDYFLEGFDMMIDQDYAIAVYPRLTFGNGQRYASKGCYIVQLTRGSDPQPVKRSDWVIY